MLTHFCDACGAPLASTFFDVTAHPQSMTIENAEGASVKLSPPEFKVVDTLLRAKGRLVTKGALYDMLYDDRADGEDPLIQIIAVWICKIRIKLKPLGLGIKLTWGTGYALCQLAEGTDE